MFSTDEYRNRKTTLKPVLEYAISYSLTVKINLFLKFRIVFVAYCPKKYWLWFLCSHSVICRSKSNLKVNYWISFIPWWGFLQLTKCKSYICSKRNEGLNRSNLTFWRWLWFDSLYFLIFTLKYSPAGDSSFLLEKINSSTKKNSIIRISISSLNSIQC